ncbi:hypothetical protein NDU88_011308 [Pleurodeles waltl]|uniref:Uncharacterized protein n=1 Tax=Pleurodeles waltl TaxID=8319 RepID=A0AAV7S4H8_PLEWA|nr:hypothetical protein NDU88_011308 [Pleurodeles waltl]
MVSLGIKPVTQNKSCLFDPSDCKMVLPLTSPPLSFPGLHRCSHHQLLYLASCTDSKFLFHTPALQVSRCTSCCYILERLPVVEGKQGVKLHAVRGTGSLNMDLRVFHLWNL